MCIFIYKHSFHTFSSPFLQGPVLFKRKINNNCPTSLVSPPNFYWGPNTTQTSRHAGCEGSTPHFLQAPQIHAKPWETRHELLKKFLDNKGKNFTLSTRFFPSFHSFPQWVGRAGPLSPSCGIKGVHSCLTPRAFVQTFISHLF